MKKRIKVIILLILVIAAYFAIFMLSNMNSLDSNNASTDYINKIITISLKLTGYYNNSYELKSDITKVSVLLNKPLRKAIHATVYFILSFLIIFLINSLFDNKRYLLSFILTILLTIILASLDEYHQTFILGRTGRLKDVFIDNIGALMGIIFYTTYYIVYKIAKIKEY